jgi:hypothetical protein
MGAGLWPPRAALGARGRLCFGLCHWRWNGLSFGGMVVSMKNLIITITAALAMTSVCANPFAETDNQAGGKIVILTDVCEADKAQSRAYFYTRDGLTEEGCWKYDAETIVIVWERQGKRRYPISMFSLMGGYRKFKAF